MRILTLIDDLRGGGTENVLANRLGERSANTEAMVVSLFPLTPLSETLRASGVEVRCLNLTKKRFFSACRELRGILENFKPDVSVCMRDVSRALFPSRLATTGSPVAVFWDNPKIIRSLKYFPLETLRARFTPPAKFAPYCSSNEIATALKSTHGLTNVPVIPNCYDSKRFSLVERKPLKDDSPLKIIAVGSARPEKNHADKIEIARRLKAAGTPFTLTIVGQNVEMALTALAKSAGVESEVRLLGVRKDIPAILADADLFLSTSTSEGMPVSLLEAMASGLPCVAYAFPSLTEINADGSFVDSVPIGEIDQAVERIMFWNANSDEAIKFGAAASANVAKRFGSHASAASWEAFLENVAETWPARQHVRRSPRNRRNEGG